MKCSCCLGTRSLSSASSGPKDRPADEDPPIARMTLAQRGDFEVAGVAFRDGKFVVQTAFSSEILLSPAALRAVDFARAAGQTNRALRMKSSSATATACAVFARGRFRWRQAPLAHRPARRGRGIRSGDGRGHPFCPAQGASGGKLPRHRALPQRRHPDWRRHFARPRAADPRNGASRTSGRRARPGSGGLFFRRRQAQCPQRRGQPGDSPKPACRK